MSKLIVVGKTLDLAKLLGQHVPIRTFSNASLLLKKYVFNDIARCILRKNET